MIVGLDTRLSTNEKHCRFQSQRLHVSTLNSNSLLNLHVNAQSSLSSFWTQRHRCALTSHMRFLNARVRSVTNPVTIDDSMLNSAHLRHSDWDNIEAPWDPYRTTQQSICQAI